MNESKINTISVDELKKHWDSDPTLCLIDVRELDEWNELRIPGALHIPKDVLKANIEITVPEHSRHIYLHCRGGVRSLHAANCLIEMGYQNVYSVDGGISAWSAAGYPTKSV